MRRWQRLLAILLAGLTLSTAAINCGAPEPPASKATQPAAAPPAQPTQPAKATQPPPTTKPSSGTAAPAPTAPPKALGTIKIGISNNSADHLPLLFAEEKGFFAKRGLKADISVVNVTAQVPALLSGEADLITAAGAALRAAWSGTPIRLVGGITIHPPLELIARPNIKDPKELKGKTIGSGGTGDTFAQLTAYALEKYGLTLNDVTYVGAGPGNQRVQALEAGTVDAAVLDFVPGRRAVANGMTRLFNIGEVVDAPTVILAAKTDTIQQRPDQLRAVIGGMLEAMAYIKGHRDEMLPYFQKTFELDAETAKAVYENTITLYSFDGKVPAEGIRGVLAIGYAFSKQAGADPGKPVPDKLSEADLRQLVDFSLLP